jgi:hypothetical protein
LINDAPVATLRAAQFVIGWLGCLGLLILIEPRAIGLAPMLGVVGLFVLRAEALQSLRRNALFFSAVALVSLSAIVGGAFTGVLGRSLSQGFALMALSVLSVFMLLFAARVPPELARRAIGAASLLMALALGVACLTDLWFDATQAGVDIYVERQNMLAVILVLLALPVLVVSPGLGRPALTAVAGIGIVALLILTQSQTAWLAVLVGGLAWLTDKLFGRRAVWLVSATFAIVLVAAPVIYPFIHRFALGLSSTGLMGLTVKTRLDIWAVAAGEILAHPIFGHGVHGLRGKVAFLASERVAIANHLHSLPLTLWVDTGLVGVAGALGVLVCMERAISGLSTQARRAATVAFAAVLTVGLVEYVLWFEWLIGALAMVATLIVLIERAGQDQSLSPSG